MSLDVNLFFDVDTGNEPHKAEVYEFNITHNLGKMASECGLYNPMWRPYKLYNIPDEQEENFHAEAGEIADALEKGLEILKNDPAKFKMFNPDNGWGDYDGLVRVATGYLDACQRYPKAKVDVWR